MNQPAIFCGVVRNGGPALRRSLERIDLIRQRCAYSRVIVVTNDNTDETDSTLENWRRDRSDCEIIRADGLADAMPLRVDRICAARNLYMHEIRKSARKEGFRNLVVADLDGPNEDLDPKCLDQLESLPFHWDAVFPNQVSCYYDIYALRHERWCPADCWEEVAQDSSILRRIPGLKSRRKRARIERCVHARQYRIPVQAAPIAVRSAFGGLGVYRLAALEHGWYASRDAEGRLVCEHVRLNETLAERGGKLFILPSLVNASPAEHLSASSGMPFPEYLHDT